MQREINEKRQQLMAKEVALRYVFAISVRCVFAHSSALGIWSPGLLPREATPAISLLSSFKGGLVDTIYLASRYYIPLSIPVACHVCYNIGLVSAQSYTSLDSPI
jgi:hypothetical protein